MLFQGDKSMKMSSFRLMILVMVVALLAAACGGGGAATSTPDTTSNVTPTSEGGAEDGASTTAGDPAVPVQNFFNALFAGESIDDLVCTTSPEVADALRQSAEAMSPTAGATIDTSGLTYVVIDQTDERATVEVSGDLVFDVSGTSSTVPYPGTTVTVVNENGNWVVCG
jgi:hypothetical protein